MITVLAIIAGLLLLPVVVDLIRQPSLRRLGLRNMVRRPSEAALVPLGAMLATAIICSSFVVGDTIDASIRDVARTDLGPLDEVIRIADASQLPAIRSAVEHTPLPATDGITELRWSSAAVSVRNRERAEPQAQLIEIDFDSARAFGLEGACYTVTAAVLGVVAGIGFGRIVVRLSFSIFRDESLRFVFAVHGTSMLTSGLIGLIIGQLTVWLTSARIARLNVIAALRDLPDPRGRAHRGRVLVGSALISLAGGALGAVASLVRGFPEFLSGPTRRGLVGALTGFDASSLSEDRVAELATRASGYADDRAVFDAVLADPTLIVVDDFFLRDGGGPGGERLAIGDDVTDFTQDGSERRFRVVGTLPGSPDRLIGGFRLGLRETPCLLTFPSQLVSTVRLSKAPTDRSSEVEMLNTLLSRYARHAVAGLVLTGSLGLGFAGVAAAAPNRPEHPTSPTSTTRVPRPEPTTSTTRPPRPAESEFNCKRAAGALIELRKHNQELALRYARLQKLRDEAVAAGKTEAVARIDKAIAEATARHAALLERAKTVAAKISEKCSPADQASVEGGADVDG